MKHSRNCPRIHVPCPFQLESPSLWSRVRLWVQVYQTAAEPTDPAPPLWTSVFLAPKCWCRFSPKQYTTCPHEWSGQQIGDAVYKRFVLKMPILQVTLYFWSNFCSFFFFLNKSCVFVSRGKETWVRQGVGKEDFFPALLRHSLQYLINCTLNVPGEGRNLREA